MLLEGVGVASPTQAVAVLNGSLTTLADAELFAYLCVHGATHGWFRLKWLADLGAWLAGKREDEIAGFYAEAERLGVGACAGQALLLCRNLLGLGLPTGLQPKLRAGKLHQAGRHRDRRHGRGRRRTGARPAAVRPFRLLPAQFRRGRGVRFVLAGAVC